MLAQAIIEDNLPISYPYSKGVRKFNQALRQGFTPVKRGNMMEVSKLSAISNYPLIIILLSMSVLTNC